MRGSVSGTFGKTEGLDPTGQHHLQFLGAQERAAGSGWLSNPWVFT
jgi:hypothetical protein